MTKGVSKPGKEEDSNGQAADKTRVTFRGQRDRR